MTEIIIKGTLPTDPRQRVLLIEAALKSICTSANQDPADGIMVLLTAAAHLSAQHTKNDVNSTMRLLAECLGNAIVAADDFFKLRNIKP